MTYRLAYERLKAYEPKRLCRDRYHNYAGDCCALGAVAPSTRAYFSLPIAEIYHTGGEVTAEIDALGMSEDEAVTLQRVNDSDIWEGLEGRYMGILAWLKDRAAGET
jgi:hypothetical protein